MIAKDIINLAWRMANAKSEDGRVYNTTMKKAVEEFKLNMYCAGIAFGSINDKPKTTEIILTGRGFVILPECSELGTCEACKQAFAPIKLEPDYAMRVTEG